ncbi:MAG: tetratricopeptide repeat protein [Blastocatellia bacterium]
MLAVCLSILASSCSRGAQLDQAQAAWDGGDYPRAVEYYEQYLVENPSGEKAAFARYQLATVYRRDLKQCDKAIPHYIHLIEDFPKSPDVYNARVNLAECYSKTDKSREAISEYETLLPQTEDGKEKRRVRLRIAELYYKANDYGQALAEFQKVTANAGYDDLCELAYLQIGGIHLLRDDFDEAIPAFETVSQNTSDREIRRLSRYRLTDCYERTFQYDQAVKVLEETEVDPKNANYIPQRIATIREQQRQRSLSPSSTLDAQRKR